MDLSNWGEGEFSLYEELKGESGALIYSLLCMEDFAEHELVQILRAIIHGLIVVSDDDLEIRINKIDQLREALMIVISEIDHS